MRLRLFLLTCAAAAVPAAALAQPYILRPGPRGFDPKLNRYGATETAPTAPAGEDRFNPSRTTVKVELLMQGDGGGLSAQRWSKTLSEVGYPARIRRPILNDKMEVVETTRGTLRFVTVTGSLDGRGNLVFPDRTFTPDEAASLREWLDELKAYGAQGSPEGRPLWGLSASQFESVYEALSAQVEAEIAGLPLKAAIAKLPAPKSYAIRFAAAAGEVADDPAEPPVSRSVAGLTAGTALAFVLSEHGLGFRPERRPEGGIDLLVVPLPAPAEAARADDAKSPVTWPVGWSVERPAGPRGERPVKDEDAVLPDRFLAAPELLRQREAIGLSEPSLAAALATVERQTGVPLLLDRAGIAAARLDLEAARVDIPTRNTSWNLVLRSAMFPSRLRHEIRRDEAGHPLVWVVPLRTGR